MRTGLITAISALLLASPAHAKWEQYRWKFDTTFLEQRCVTDINENGPVCVTKAQREQIANRNRLATTLPRWTEAELEKIGRWMDRLGFPQVKMWSGNKPSPLPPGQIDVRGTGRGILAAYKGGEILVPEDNFVDVAVPDREVPFNDDEVPEVRNTLAHEMFHGVQANTRGGLDESTGGDPFKWLVEGTAEAVGIIWEVDELNYPSEGVNWKQGRYDEPLHLPTDHYGRAHFFYHAMRDRLSRGSPARNMVRLFDRPYQNKTDRGLSAFQDSIEALGEPFRRVYRHVVNFRAIDRAFFMDNPDRFTSPSLAVQPMPGAPSESSASRTVGGIATRYDEVGVIFGPAGWNQMYDGDRLVGLTIEVDRADRAQELTLSATVFQDGKLLIYDGDEQDRFAMAVFAEEGKLTRPVITKVINMAEQIEQSTQQQFRLALKAEPLLFQLPACVSIGDGSPIENTSNVSLKDLKTMRRRKLFAIKAERGEVTDDLIYIAPATPGSDTIYAELLGIDGKTRQAEIGTVDVANTECAVMVTFQPNKDARAIWNPATGVTEWRAPEGTILFKGDEMAFKMGAGWRKMRLSQMGMSTGSVKLPNLPGIDVSGLARFGAYPKLMLETYPYQKMALAADVSANATTAAAQIGEARLQSSDCPDDPTSQACAVIELSHKGEKAFLVYDANRRLVQIRHDLGTIFFAYGGFKTRPWPP